MDVKNNKLIKSIGFEGLRVIGEINNFAKKYYNEGIDYWNDDTFTDGKLGVVSLTCQTALEKMTKGEKLWNYRDIIVDVVMKQVSFYKFKLNKGDPQFFMSNDLYNKIPNNAQFYLRNKSSKSRPYRETVGVQP